MTFILRRFRRDEGGATAIEYTLIVGLVALVAWMGFTHLVEASVNRTGERLNNAMSAAAGRGDGASGRSWSLSYQCDSGRAFEEQDRRSRDRCGR
jgi:Flp pilus assembly pilin Flp